MRRCRVRATPHSMLVMSARCEGASRTVVWPHRADSARRLASSQLHRLGVRAAHRGPAAAWITTACYSYPHAREPEAQPTGLRVAADLTDSASARLGVYLGR